MDQVITFLYLYQSYIVVFMLLILTVLIIIFYLEAKKISDTSKKISKTSLEDVLTKIPNRQSFLKDIDEKILKKDKFSLFFLDLDGFKSVNDTLGHDAGDELLIKISNTIKKILIPPSNVYRLGGDEFAMIVSYNEKNELKEIASKIQNGIRDIKKIEGEDINIDSSLGIAIYGENGDTRKELLRAADNAMYYIKENGKGDHYFFSNTLKERIENEQYIENAIIESLKKGDFIVAYRPKRHLTDAGNNDINIDTTLRWNHPLLGTVEPKFFLDIAMKSNLIVELEEFVLQEVMNTSKELQNKGINNVVFSVKTCMKHFKRHESYKKIKEIILGSGIKNRKILLEITDNMDADSIQILKNVIDEEFENLGISLVIDNIVIKASTIELLQLLPIKEIKVDRRFIDEKDSVPKGFLENTIKLVHSLDLEAIILGINDKQKFDEAKKLGFDIVEGNYISKPLNKLEIIKYVKTIIGNEKE